LLEVPARGPADCCAGSAAAMVGVQPGGRLVAGADSGFGAVV